MVKTRTIRKWELNTCDNFVNLGAEDFFVGRRRSKIYTMWKFCQKYIQYSGAIYTINMWLYAGSFEGNAYSRLFRLLRNDGHNAPKTSLSSHLFS